MPGCNARHCRWRTMARPDWRGVEDKLGEVWETLLAKSGTQDWRGVERPVGKEWKDWRAGNTILLKVVMDVVPQEITNDKNSVFLHYVSSENLYQKVTDGPAFPEKILLASRSRFLEDLSALKFDNDEEKWLVSFVDAYQGFPSKIENSYGRMLYLSAITITTVGFGDIVPITDFCRIMLAFEAILGIIVSGCFVTTIFMVKKMLSIRLELDNTMS